MSPNASIEVIEAAYRSLIKRSHPDVSPRTEGAEAKTKRLNVAHDWLTDPSRRARWDAGRSARPVPDARRPEPPRAGRPSTARPRRAGTAFPIGHYSADYTGMETGQHRGGMSIVVCPKCGRTARRREGVGWRRFEHRGRIRSNRMLAKGADYCELVWAEGDAFGFWNGDPPGPSTVPVLDRAPDRVVAGQGEPATASLRPLLGFPLGWLAVSAAIVVALLAIARVGPFA